MTTLATTILAYAIGCLTTGYYLVRAIAGDDLRAHATGSTGARNVGRRLGPAAAVATFAGDVARGALAVAIARAVAGATAGALALPAVVIGHVAPVQLRFRGGRGLGPAVGGLAVLDWRVAAAGLAVAAGCAAATRAPTVAGLVGTASTVPAALLAGTRPTAAAAVATTAVILAAHARPRPQLQG